MSVAPAGRVEAAAAQKRAHQAGMLSFAERHATSSGNSSVKHRLPSVSDYTDAADAIS